MSMWTHVCGAILVDTNARSTPEAMYMAQTVVNHLPRITGSEGDAHFYLNTPDGHNVTSSVDEFFKPSNLYNHNSWYEAFEIQTWVLITVQGDFRDRVFSETLRETTRMLARLSSRLRVRNCSVTVEGDWGERFTFASPEWIVNSDVSDWAMDLLWKFDSEEEEGESER